MNHFQQKLGKFKKAFADIAFRNILINLQSENKVYKITNYSNKFTFVGFKKLLR